VLARVFEGDVRADYEVLDSGGDPDLRRARESSHPRTDVDGQPLHPVAREFYFTGVHACSDLQTEARHGLADREGAVNRSRRSVEVVRRLAVPYSASCRKIAN